MNLIEPDNIDLDEKEKKCNKVWDMFRANRISYNETVDKINSIWQIVEPKLNLLRNLEEFLLNQITIHPKEKSQMSPNKYFKTLAEKMDKLAQNPERWLYEYQEKFPEQLKTLDSQQKQSLTESIKTLDFQEFSWFMGLLCRMLDYLDQNDYLESELGKALMANHAFLKLELFPELYPEQHQKFNQRLHKNKKLEADRPNCPKCGSNKLVSNGINWYCKSCGRQTNKKLV